MPFYGYFSSYFNENDPFMPIFRLKNIKMTKNRKISSQEFDYLAKMEPYLPKNDQNGCKSLKYGLLESVEGAFGDKWFNLRDKTRQAIDYICFLSIDRGFVYASPGHIAKRSGISKSTIYDALKLMRDEEILYKANRCSKKQNGLGCPVHFFTVHPYFDHINAYLNLDWKPQQKADRKAEIAETPTPATVISDSSTSTYSLPTHDHISIDMHPNVLADAQNHPQSKIIKYVPKEINELYANVFGNRLRSLWVKITQAWKSIKQCILDRDSLITIGRKIIKRVFQLWKQHERDGRVMTIDDMSAYAYTSARDSIYNTLAEIHMEDYEIIDATDRLDQVEEAKREIAYLEDVYLRKQPYATLEMVRSNVLRDIAVMFPLLWKTDISHLERDYMQFTSQTHFTDDLAS